MSILTISVIFAKTSKSEFTSILTFLTKIVKIVKKRVYEHFDDFGGFRQNRPKVSFSEHLGDLPKTLSSNPCS